MAEVEQLEGDLFSDMRYAVSIDSRPMCIVGFRMESMIEMLTYVTLDPMPGLYKAKPSDWRAMRAKLAEEFPNFKLFCQVDSDRNRRFAEFFGFKFKGHVYGRMHLVRE